MAKKDNETLYIVGGVALLALLLFRKKSAVVTPIASNQQHLLPVNTVNTNNGNSTADIITAVNKSGIISTIADLFKGGGDDTTSNDGYGDLADLSSDAGVGYGYGYGGGGGRVADENWFTSGIDDIDNALLNYA